MLVDLLFYWQVSAADSRDNQLWWLLPSGQQPASCWHIRTPQVLCLSSCAGVGCSLYSPVYRAVMVLQRKTVRTQVLTCLHAGRLMGFKPNDREAESALGAKKN